MLAGHFALAAAVKSRGPQVPLWALMLSTQLLDVIFLVLYLAGGIETLKPAEGSNGGYGSAVISANYTHSLVGAFLISAVAALVAGIPWGRKNGLVIGGMVLSHWFLDLLVHRPDLPLLPGNAGNLPLLGLGLWSIPWLSATVELMLVLTGAFLYYHAAVRNAIRAERRDARGDGPLVSTVAPNAAYRSRALVTSVVMFAALLSTLAADFFYGM